MHDVNLTNEDVDTLILLHGRPEGKVIDKRDIKKENMAALLAVLRGSGPPRPKSKHKSE